jgi:hypothetical protein
MLPDRDLDDLLAEMVSRINSLADQVNELQRMEQGEGLVDYSAVSTIIGWSSFTVKQLSYWRDGKKVTVQYRLSGTSDSAAVNFTLPYMQNAIRLRVPHFGIDSGGAIVIGLGELGASTSTFHCYPAPAGGNWTPSGTKEVSGQFTYHMV